MLLTSQVLPFLCFVGCIVANTETYLLRIPRYFEIASCPKSMDYSKNYAHEYKSLNATHKLLMDYPVNTIVNQSSPHIFALPYNKVDKEENVLMVRLNNYDNNTFASDDLIYVKLCWPTTLPYQFDLSHDFIKVSSLVVTPEDSFDIFFKISYKLDAYTYDPAFLSDNEKLQFQLFITKLPNRWIPIPLELYGTIIYILDLIILSWTAIPWIFSYLAE